LRCGIEKFFTEARVTLTRFASRLNPTARDVGRIRLSVWSRLRSFPSAALRLDDACGRCGKGASDHGHLPAQCIHDGASDAAVRQIRTIDLSDLHDALRRGWEGFKAVPSHANILCMIYPILGLVLARVVHGYSVIPLLFPLAAGFALLGPFAAIGLHELSRKRERGESATAWDALDVLRSPSFSATFG
jgi:Predicted integral membrane protein (DUF2189)